MIFAVQASKRHVSEEVAKQIHEKVAPVITWLQTAEVESDEEDEEVEVVYSEQASKTKLITETIQVQNVSWFCTNVWWRNVCDIWACSNVL